MAVRHVCTSLADVIPQRLNGQPKGVLHFVISENRILVLRIWLIVVAAVVVLVVVAAVARGRGRFRGWRRLHGSWAMCFLQEQMQV